MVKACLFINGNKTIQELAEAKVPVLDSAFLFGDGVYEVIAVVNGKYFDLAPHLDRLENSLKIVSIAMPMSRSEMVSELEQLVDAQSNGYVYLQVTRGAHSVRDFEIQGNDRATFFAYHQPKKNFPQQTAEEGETSIIFPDIRWGLKHVKTTQLLSSRLARKTAVENGAAEPIYINQQGFITEGGSTNIFIINGRKITTHPATNAILGGITRIRVIELAKAEGFMVVERKFSLDELLAADEVFRTSTTMGIRGIAKVKIIENPPAIFGDVEADTVWQPVKLGMHQIGDGLAGSITRDLSFKYSQLAQKLCN